MRIASSISLSVLILLNCTASFAIETTKLNPAPTTAFDPARVFQSRSIEVVLNDQPSAGSEKIRAVRVRDADTKKIAQIQLTKSDPTATSWAGFFVIQFVRGDDAPRVLEFLNKNGSPYFVYSSQEKGIQRISLFLTAEQLDKHISSLGKAATQQQAAPTQAEVQRQARAETRQQEQVQTALEVNQAMDRGALIEAFGKLPAAEKKKRKEQAKQLAQQGADFYSQQKYKEAGVKFQEASNRDPEEDSYYYKYGVSLYKSEEYNKSLAVLSLAEPPSGSELEKDYYLGLNFLKLKDYDKALKKFTEIRAEEDESLSPVASYFAGTIEMQKQKFNEARKSMEFVLDNSKDPALDKSAEEAMEQIDKLEAFYMRQKEKFRISLFSGLVYDENVLNVATNNVATDVQAYRVNYGATLLGFWFIHEDSDLGTQVSFSDYYSLDTSLQADAALQTADPMEFSVTVPYNKQFEKVSWNLEPVFRSIYMSPTGGTRKEIIRSIGASTTLASLVQKDLYLSGKLDYSSDTSKLDVTTPQDDQTGYKTGLTITPTKILDLKGEKTLSGEVSYLINQSQGENYRYKRTGLAVTYGFPSYATSTSSLRLDYGSQAYSEALTPRTDTTLSATLSGNKDLKKYLNLNLSLQYNSANSSLDLYKYNKFVITSLLTYKTSVFDK